MTNNDMQGLRPREREREMSHKAGRERILPQSLLGIMFAPKDDVQRVRFTDLRNKTHIHMYPVGERVIVCALFLRFVGLCALAISAERRERATEGVLAYGPGRFSVNICTSSFAFSGLQKMSSVRLIKVIL